MPTSITRSVVRKQLCAMGCELFEIGVFHQDALMLLRNGWSAAQIDAALGWLSHENARGAHIFVRPHGAHALSLIDDLKAEGINRMRDRGFQPAVVVETSPSNFQVWLNHGQIISDRTFSTRAAQELACRFGGDSSSADWRHFGRLAGFTNQKPKRRLGSGLAPFVRLRQCEGRAYTEARGFLEEVKSLAEKALAERAAATKTRATSIEESVRPLTEFQRDPRYGGDLHRADMAWALHAASRGLSEQQIRNQILNVRDLTKKGGPQRQINYARRTANKALRTVEPMH
jgi:RepB DNA-primase from phage plasmid